MSLMVFSFSRDEFTFLYQNSITDVSVVAHPDGHQHGVSIQSFKNRGNISPNIAHMRKITPT